MFDEEQVVRMEDVVHTKSSVTTKHLQIFLSFLASKNC